MTLLQAMYDVTEFRLHHFWILLHVCSPQVPQMLSSQPWLGCGLTMLNISDISYINILTQDYLGVLVLPGTVRKLYTHTFLR